MKTISNILITGLFALVLLASCDKCITGEGPQETQTLIIADFDAIDLATVADVTITQGSQRSVTATSQAEIIDLIKTGVNNGKWTIDLDGKCFNNFNLTIDIVTPFINEISISGSGEVQLNDFIDQFNMDMNISGSGTILTNKLDGMEMLNVDISGSGEVKSSGVTEELSIVNVDISGSGSYEGFNIPTVACFADVSGSGVAESTVSGQLNADISGSGAVAYKGMPVITSSITGSGEIVDAN